MGVVFPLYSPQKLKGNINDINPLKYGSTTSPMLLFQEVIESLGLAFLLEALPVLEAYKNF